MKYKALLLDFYGTLVAEDDHLILTLLQEIAACSPVSSDVQRIGRDWDFQPRCQSAYADNFKTQRAIEVESLLRLLDVYQADLDAHEMAERLFAYWQTPTIYEDAGRFLHNNALPICVVSNIDTGDLCAACLHTGWEFENIVTSESCRSYKPRPEMFLCALGKLGCTAHEVLHIGDSLSSDVKGAQALEIAVVWVDRKNRELPVNAVSPSYTVSTLDALSFL